jgi:hypothetical protein
MALDAIVEVGEAPVLPGDLRRRVGVAAVAGVLLVVRRVLVAGCAGIGLAPIAVRDREGVLERGPLPRRRRVALGAPGSELPLVDRQLGVTRHASLRSAFEDLVLVAVGAGDRLVFAGQLERRQVVVEFLRRCPAPGCGGVALGAPRAESALVSRRLGVAGDTEHRRPLEEVVLVARGAIDRLMLAGQLERGQVVVEPIQVGQGGVCALVLRMAGAALHPVGESAVERVMAGYLLLDVFVAAQTALRHGRAAERAGVAGRAGPAQLDVGSHSTQPGPAAVLRVEPAGTEHPAAADHQADSDGQQRDQRRDQP